MCFNPCKEEKKMEVNQEATVAFGTLEVKGQNNTGNMLYESN